MRKKIVQRLGLYLKLNNIGLNIGIFLLYVILGKVGLSLAYVNPSATVIWAPTGIALATLLIFGIRVLPAIFFGAFVVNMLTAGGIPSSLGIALGNTLEGFVGMYLVRRFANGINALDTILGVLKFVFFAALLSTVISATIGVTTLILARLATPLDFWAIWLTWWMGDVGGAILVAPLFLVWATHLRIGFAARGVLHYLLAISSLIIVTELVFWGVIPYPYLCIPVAVWIAFWFGRRGATTTTIIVAVLAIINTLHGAGPFSHALSVNKSLLLLQIFLDIFSLTVLTFAVTLLEYRKTEKLVALQEKRFKALIENSFESVVLIDISSRILYASPSVKRLLGYSPEELQGKAGLDLVIEEDREDTKKSLSELVFKPGGTKTVEYRTLRKDNKIIWVEATGTNLLFEPNINAVVVNFRDITDKKLADEAMLEEKMEDEAMLGSIGDGLIATDKDGIITIVNQRGCEILQVKEKELIGKSIITAIPMEGEDNKILPIEDRPMTKVLRHGRKIVTSSDVYYVRKDKTKFPVHFTVTPVLLDNKIAGTIEVFQDITKEKEIDKAKTEFVSLASHQLRTPLATINWYLEELIKEQTHLTPKQSTYLQEVYKASKRMVDLINAVLNTSRLELGTLAVEPIKTDIRHIASQVIHDLEPRCNEKKVTIKASYQKELPSMQADPKLLTMVIQNLLGNAVKYTKETDTILFEATSTSKTFEIKVSDHGYGIPANQQAKIFSKLFRADNARTMDPEGNGLGLYIVKSIVDVTGGKIRFESEENKGTTFFVSYPLLGMQQKAGRKQLI